MWYTGLLDKDLVPDFIIRYGIRKLLAQRLKAENKGNPEAQQAHFMRLVEELKSSPIAVNTIDANAQHYEIPADFFRLVMGKYMKYSSGYWKEGVTSIDTSEKDMLEITCERAALKDGQHILELGCGWGSLSLFMAEKFPDSKITSVSNSHSQKTFIDGQAQHRNIKNLTVITADVNVFQITEKFDRVVSVEMFEHMRNYELLMSKVASFLKPEGKLFVHIFTHKEYAYKFEVVDDSDWMSKYFFTGGIMPSDHLLLYFQKELKITQHWRVSGLHYEKTSHAWLHNMDSHKQEIMKIMERVYGKQDALKWWCYWRIFFMACAELWGYKDGNEWMVSHYLFQKGI
ncbi:MAG TPA: cyclopropane-fatty-acyl-phospholipid synthase family protein [Bacteroidia bacterium]|jgi:cyclopropane-fatty-acyl-phospholipid synthase|nr:cyclopropane-fatty-acyl-phospholipid synthase family protein [Bacteroidia bacterium]